MYSVKKNVLQTVALIKAYGIQKIVLSPGSRNSPLLQTFSQDTFFDCHVVVDERNAAFYALGIIQATGKPVAICCTSGTALLNYAPAVAEAYYQQLPLVVISSDRATEWIGQMDGQTIPQVGALGTLVRKSVQLPEVTNAQDEWYCNRLVNEALIACTSPSPCPVHINIPIAEPLFDYSETELPTVRKISYTSANKAVDIKRFVAKWDDLPKRMIVVGQLPKSEELVSVLDKLATERNCVILAEHISNCISPNIVSNFDPILYKLSDEEKATFSPDLLITFGGHIISKRLKYLLRGNKPKEHWHLSVDTDVVDLYQSLTDIVETDIINFLTELSSNIKKENKNEFAELWRKESKTTPEPKDINFSDISAVGSFLKVLPKGSQLHLANSSSVRNAQLFSLDKSITINSNRGTNGIESSLPSAIGFAAVSKEPVYLIIGDLSFFYTVGSLWNMEHIKNLRILLINNGGGGIFHLLPGLNKAASLKEYVATEHTTNARKWADAAGLNYLEAKDEESLDRALKEFVEYKTEKSIILEVTTDIEISKAAMQAYYHSLTK